MNKLALYFHTVRHLRATQVLGRVWYRLYRPTPDLRAAPPLRAQINPMTPPITPARSMMGRDIFRFLNVERQCSLAEDWIASDTTKLWRYNLHYFDDLNAEGSQERSDWHRELIERWVAQNPPGWGDGWEPYPISRRIVNWVKWPLLGNQLSGVCSDSLATQTRWLSRKLEFHILGNHLLANAKALVFAGCYFGGKEADTWLSRGLNILESQLREQIRPDGGHFELSPMYHAIVLEDVLDLVNVLRTYQMDVPAAWYEYAECMQRWLLAMTHPDGGIAFFNDAAFGIAPTLEELRDYAARLQLPMPSDDHASVTSLPSSGYVRALKGVAYLVCDCAQVGPDYLPGHAHADTLSFELSLGGQRVFVNSGTSLYGSDTERQRQRGTAAHNTVVVDGLNSSEVWDGFRVARRAKAILHFAGGSSNDELMVVEASHEGYRRLQCRVEHRRRWEVGDGSLRIEDKLVGKMNHAEARFHVHPAVRLASVSSFEIELLLPSSERVRMSFDNASSMEVTEDTWHPEFGLSVRAQCIVARFADHSLTTHINWGKL